MSDHIAEKLNQNTDKIINLWEERVRQEVEAAKFQKKLALQNSLHGFLKQLGEELSEGYRSQTAISEGKSKSRSIGKEHGKLRANTLKYTIDQLIYEYHILRQVISEFLASENLLTPKAHETIVAYIEQAVNDAATEFSNTLNEIQDRLSRTLVHDLRSPMTVAKISAELMLRNPGDSNNCTEKAKRISYSMDRIDRMVRELLDSTRFPTKENSQILFSECDLNKIIRDITEDCNLSHPGKVEFDSHHHTVGVWNVEGLRRIVENLITNAIKYGDEKSPVTVTLKDNGKGISLAVHNEGNPIHEDVREKLFRPYHQSEDARKRHLGWGLGLSVVKTFVDAHHGEITVESNKDNGTTFEITLPHDSRIHHSLSDNPSQER